MQDSTIDPIVRRRRQTGTRLVTVLAWLGIGLAGCASTPPAAPPSDQGSWSVTRVVETDESSITLFDPDDLSHHEYDPPNWHAHDFAFADDLSAGRFVAVVTGRNGALRVRVTDAPLTAAEREAAGTSATMRLRVRQERLLLAGGDAWPSSERRGSIGPHDRRWLSVPNGDYRAVATVMERAGIVPHDYVVQLLPVPSIDEVDHAPGLPRLAAGDLRPGVVGIDAPGARFVERCAAVPREAELSPLIANALPLPGGWGEVEVSAALHERGRALQDAGQRADLPLVIARQPQIGALGVYLAPSRWLVPDRDRFGRDRYRVRGRTACAVRITSMDTRQQGLVLGIEPLPSAADRLPEPMAHELVDRFEAWLRVTSDPAHRYKSAAVRRATDYRSLVFGVMRHASVPPERAEALLQMSNEQRALELIEHLDTGR